MRRYSYIALLLLVSLNASAISSNFSDYKNYAKGSYQNLHDKIGNFNAEQFKNFNSNPDTTKYYKNDNAIKSDTKENILNSNASKDLVNTSNRDQEYVINSKSPGVSRALLAQGDAYNITHGISDKYVNCQKASSCHSTYYQSECTRNVSTKMNCFLTPKVTVDNTPYQVTVPYSGNMTPTDNYHAEFTLPESGVIKSISIVMKNRPDIWRCHMTYTAKLNDVFISNDNVPCGWGLGDMSYQNTQLNIPIKTGEKINFSFGGGPSYGNQFSVHYVLQLDLTRYKKQANIVMQNSCDPVSSLCSVAKNQCIEDGGTKNIDGVPVHEDCWKNELTYTCGLGVNHSCDSLMNEGCTINQSQCAKTLNGVCISYQQILSCPKTQCPHNNEICGEHAFCMDGNCYEPKPTENKDFGKDEAQLAAASGGAAGIANNQQSLSAFSGHSMSCSLAPLGFLNCCADHGWGKDIDLAKCSTEEKKLAQAKKDGFAIEVGKYCSDSILGICISHRKSYCVFDGLIANDVQRQGRQWQLHKDFGSAKNPDCSGLTVDELQKIDFSKINFSNAESSLAAGAHFPNQADIEKIIVNKIKREMGNK